MFLILSFSALSTGVGVNLMQTTSEILVTCSNGAVLIPTAEFERLLDHLQALRSLVYGHPQMISTSPKFDVFSEFGVSAEALNTIRWCIRDGQLPDDEIALSLARSGELRHASDAMGGCETVVTALNDYRVKQSRKAATPVEDVDDIYEWRAAQDYGELDSVRSGERFRSALSDGFELASSVVSQGQTHMIHHFRRLRPAAGVAE